MGPLMFILIVRSMSAPVENIVKFHLNLNKKKVCLIRVHNNFIRYKGQNIILREIQDQIEIFV